MRFQVNEVLNQLAVASQANSWSELDELTRQQLRNEIVLYDDDKGEYTTTPALWFGRIVEGAKPAANRLTNQDLMEISQLNKFFEHAGFKKRLPERTVKAQITVRDIEVRAKELKEWVQENKEPVRVEALCKELEALCLSPDSKVEKVLSGNGLEEALSSAMSDNVEGLTVSTIRESVEKIPKSKLCDLVGICYQTTGSANGILNYLKSRLERLEQSVEVNQSLIGKLKVDIGTLGRLEKIEQYLPSNGSKDTIAYVAEIMLDIRTMDLEAESAEGYLIERFEKLCEAYPKARESLLVAEQVMLESLPDGHKLKVTLSKKVLNELLAMRESGQPERLKFQLPSTVLVDQMARSESLAGNWRGLPVPQKNNFNKQTLVFSDKKLKPETSGWGYRVEGAEDAGAQLNKTLLDVVEELNLFAKAMGSSARFPFSGRNKTYTVHQLESIQVEMNKWVEENNTLIEAWQTQKRIVDLACRERIDDECGELVEKVMDAEIEHLLELVHKDFVLSETAPKFLIKTFEKPVADSGGGDLQARHFVAYLKDKAGVLTKTCQAFPTDCLVKPNKVAEKALPPILKALEAFQQAEPSDMDQDYFAALSLLCESAVPLNVALDAMDTFGLAFSENQGERVRALSETVRMVVYESKQNNFEDVQPRAKKLLAKVDALKAGGDAEPPEAAAIKQHLTELLNECNSIKLKPGFAMDYIMQMTSDVSEVLTAEVAAVNDLCNDLMAKTTESGSVTAVFLGQLAGILDQLNAKAERATPEEQKEFDGFYESVLCQCAQVGIDHRKASELLLNHVKGDVALAYVQQLDNVHQLVPMKDFPPKGLIVILHNAVEALESLKKAGADITQRDTAKNALINFIAISIERPDLIELPKMLNQLKAWIDKQESGGELFQSDLEDGLLGKRKPADAYSLQLSNVVTEAEKYEKDFNIALKNCAKEGSFSDFNVARWAEVKTNDIPKEWRDAFVCRGVLCEHRKFVSHPKETPWKERVYRSKVEPDAEIYSNVDDVKTDGKISSVQNTVVAKKPAIVSTLATGTESVSPPPPPPPLQSFTSKTNKPPAAPPPPPPPVPKITQSILVSTDSEKKKKKSSSTNESVGKNEGARGVDLGQIKEFKLRKTVKKNGKAVSTVTDPEKEGATKKNDGKELKNNQSKYTEEELAEKSLESMNLIKEKKKKALEERSAKAREELEAAKKDAKGVDAAQQKMNQINEEVKEFNKNNPRSKIGSKSVLGGAESDVGPNILLAFQSKLNKKFTNASGDLDDDTSNNDDDDEWD